MDKITKFSLIISLWMSLSYVSSYNYKDVDAWTKKSPLCGNGKRQSPIDLDPNCKTVNYFPLDVKNYAGNLCNATISNVGDTVKITGNWEKSIPTVTGPLINNAKFLLDEVHLHWSQKDYSGTDHSINGKRYACEVHFVHYNSKYRNANAAMSKVDGLLVIGLLYKVNKKTPNLGLQAMTNFIASVREVNSESTGILDLGLFGIEKMKSFYSYSGSLTAPPCAESVHWVVSDEVLPTNAAIMKVIRSTKLRGNDKHNVRPIQSLNGREVVLYKK